MNYREEWYATRGLPYEPPRLEGTDHLRHIGINPKLAPKRGRQPGDDDEVVREDPIEEAA